MRVRASTDGDVNAADAWDDGAYVVFATCRGHSSTVLSVDWSSDGRVVQSSSQSYELLYHDAFTGRQVVADMRDARWLTWTSPIGFPVIGVWGGGGVEEGGGGGGGGGGGIRTGGVWNNGEALRDTSDLITCCRAPSGKHAVTGDDGGRLRLLNYPCVAERAPAREYCAHSSHVSQVRFDATGARLASTGGHDRAVLVWRTLGGIRGSIRGGGGGWVILRA